VLIDDMDRLEPDELHQMLGLIKAMSDIKKVVFLLAIDNESTEIIMNQNASRGGSYSLEKVVDVSLSLPIFDRFALENALNLRLAAMMKQYNKTDETSTSTTKHMLIDYEYWAIIFTHIAVLVQQPRDVVRFCDALSITYASQYSRVHAVDFIAVEALRFFVPQLYDFLRLYPEQCVGNTSITDVYQTHEFLALCAQKIVITDEQVPASHLRRDAVLKLLRKLFPALDRRTLSHTQLQELGAMHRVCASLDLFARYFRYDVSHGDKRRSDIMALVRNVKSEQMLCERLQRMTDPVQEYHKRIPAMIERLHDHVDSDIALTQVPMYVRVLLDIGDELVTAQPKYSFIVSDDWRIAKLVVRLMMRVPLNTRGALLYDAIQGAARGVQARVIHFCVDALDQNPDNDDSGLIISLPWVNKCKQQWLNQIGATGGISQQFPNTMVQSIIMRSHTAWKGQQLRFES